MIRRKVRDLSYEPNIYVRTMGEVGTVTSNDIFADDSKACPGKSVVR